MKNLVDFEDDVHSCSKCGLCQSVCPLYKITGNDCAVSRGHFIMLRGLIKGELKMSKTINKYLDMCIKCNACSKFCPSAIDVVDIVASAKAEFFRTSWSEKFISFIQKTFLFGAFIKFLSYFNRKATSQKFDKKVIYFGGCGAYVNHRLNKSVVKLLNSCGIEVVIPNFDCCGIPFFVRGDMQTFEKYSDSFAQKFKEYGISEIVTTCASCEKTLKSYNKWFNKDGYTVKNIFQYLSENNLKPKLKNKVSVTFHKPCNINNSDDIEWILNNTENLEYIKMEDKCCGFNGVLKLDKYNIFSKIYKDKHKQIIDTGAKIVLTSCLGCEVALKLFSFGKYKVKDFTEFFSENVMF